MKPLHWLLPETPDVLGLLEAQLTLTRSGTEAFAAWAAGAADQAAAVRRTEHEADTAKRELQRALRMALVTPLEPEDLFSLSQRIDWVLNEAKDAVGESEVMACPPDQALAQMTALLAESVHHIDEAVARLGDGDGDGDATEPADAAIKAERRLERAYRAAMGALLEIDDLREVMARRELYRRCSRIGEGAAEVAERVIYAVVKEN